MNSVHIEGDDAAEDYSFQEHQQEHDPVPEPVEEEEEETPVEEPSAFLQTAEDTVQETFPSAEEPVGEAPKLTYASIVSTCLICLKPPPFPVEFDMNSICPCELLVQNSAYASSLCP